MQCNEHHIAVMRCIRNVNSESSLVQGYAKASGVAGGSDQCQCVRDLEDAGLIQHVIVDYRYRLTDEGRAELQASEAVDVPMPEALLVAVVEGWLECLRGSCVFEGRSGPGGCPRCWAAVRRAATRAERCKLAGLILLLPERPMPEARAKRWAFERAGNLDAIAVAGINYANEWPGLVHEARMMLSEAWASADQGRERHLIPWGPRPNLGAAKRSGETQS